MFLILIFSLSYLLIKAQNLEWSWVSTAEGPNHDYAEGLCIDHNNNIYTTGSFFNSIKFGNINISDNGGGDIFLTKYDSDGNVIWSKAFGGNSLDFPIDITADDTGNIIITGAFRSPTISFDNIILSNPLSGQGANAFYIAKMDNDGKVLWASTISSDSNCNGSAITADTDGNVIVTGIFSGSSITIGNLTLQNTKLFQEDFFICKYDGVGNLIWAKSYGGNGRDFSRSVSTDNNGNINICGGFESSTLDFESTVLDSEGQRDVFLVQLSPNGDINWVKHGRGEGFNSGIDITTDGDNNVIVVGEFSGAPLTFDSQTLIGDYFQNCYVVKYKDNGELLWALASSGDGNDAIYAVSVDAGGDLWVTGELGSTIMTLGSQTITNTQAGQSDIFVANLDYQGNVKWSTNAGGNDDEYGGDIFVTENKDIYIIGSFYSQIINFDQLEVSNSSNDYYDYFLAKISAGTSSVKEEELNEAVIIFPNPTTNNVNLSINLLERSNVQFQLFSNNGSLVLSRSMGIMPPSQHNIQINLDHLNTGIYLLKIQTDYAVISRNVHLIK